MSPVSRYLLIFVFTGLLVYSFVMTYWTLSLQRQLKVEKLNVKAVLLSRDAANLRADMLETVLKLRGVRLP